MKDPELYHEKQNSRKKKVTEHKMSVLGFLYSFVSNISHSRKNWAWCDQKCLLACMQVPVILVRF